MTRPRPSTETLGGSIVGDRGRESSYEDTLGSMTVEDRSWVVDRWDT